MTCPVRPTNSMVVYRLLVDRAATDVLLASLDRASHYVAHGVFGTFTCTCISTKT